MTTLPQFVAKLEAAQAGLSQAATVGVVSAARYAGRSVEAIMPNRLSGVGKRGARLGTRVYPPRRGAASVDALLRVTGPAQLIERDTAAHDIPRQRTAGGRRRRAANKVLAFPDGGFRRGPVHHPGTSGQHPFARGVTAALPAVGRIMDEPYAAVLRSIF